MRIAIVVGSTRPGRQAETVARWVQAGASRHGGAVFEIVDLAEYALPFLDEPRPAAHSAGHVHPHTRAWSRTIAGFDGFIFVTPEYNRSTTGVLKNAIDFLYEEWHHKAVGFVGYGLAGGVRAVEHLRLVAAELKMADVRAQVALSLFDDFEDGRFSPRPHHDQVLDTLVDELVTWSRALAPLRMTLPGGSSDDQVPRGDEASGAHSTLDDGQTVGEAVVEPEIGTAVRARLRDAARPVTRTDAGAGMDSLEGLVGAIGEARVVGLGESTRAAHETFTLRDRIWRALVQARGFRTLAIQDGAAVVDDLDAWVRTGDGDVTELLSHAWRPWRTAEMTQALTWIRAFNLDHPDDQIRLLGVQPTVVQPADYDTVRALVADTAPELVGQVTHHLDTIRSAHDLDEHVQRHRGTHPGTPFVEHAREAHRLIRGLPDSAARSAALEIAERIVDFHARSVAGGGFDREHEEAVAAARILEWQSTTGQRVVYWDGIVHTAATGTAPGRRADELPSSAGGHLRRHLGRDYVSVAIGFHHGEVQGATVPAPPPDYIDGILADGTPATFYLDLRGPAPAQVSRWLAEPRKVRVINGVYDPTRDDAAHVTAASLSAWFDVLVHIREVTPTAELHNPGEGARPSDPSRSALASRRQERRSDLATAVGESPTGSSTSNSRQSDRGDDSPGG
ncbi:erythromycin esterase family protein [Blastococcus sp. SYSU DS0552]